MESTASAGESTRLLRVGQWSLDLDYTSDLLAPSSAGSGDGPIFLGSLLLGVEIEPERVVPAWKGARLKIQGLFNHGGGVDLGIGDAQGANNIQSPDVAKLFQLWLEQSFLEGRILALIGVHDLNSEFYVTESSLLFVNSSFGIGPEFGMSGVNGPSVFPSASMAARLEVRPVERLSLRAAVYEGIPGDPEDPSVTRFYFKPENGLLGVGEADLEVEVNGLRGKVGVGAWGYGNVAAVEGCRGAYVLVDHQIYAHSRGDEAGLYGFARAGMASAEVIAVSRSFQAGLFYRGVFARSNDSLGLGVAIADGGALASVESAWELTYRAQVWNEVSLQPDFQWIRNPGNDRARATAIAAGMRIAVSI